MSRDGGDEAREQEERWKGATERTGPSELLGQCRLAAVFHEAVHLPVYSQAGLGARSPGCRPWFCFVHPSNHPCDLVSWGGGESTSLSGP